MPWSEISHIHNSKACSRVDLPQVDSLIFLVMVPVYRHDKKLKRAKIPEINQIYRINRTPNARASFEVPEPEEIVRRTLRKSSSRAMTGCTDSLFSWLKSEKFRKHFWWFILCCRRENNVIALQELIISNKWFSKLHFRGNYYFKVQYHSY